MCWHEQVNYFLTYVRSAITEPLEKLKNIAWLEQSENLLIGDICVPVDLCHSDFH